MRKERKPLPNLDVYSDLKSHKKHTEDPETLWRDARLFAAQLCDVYEPAISALTPIRNDSIPTMCVDTYYRVYYNANTLFWLKEQAEAVSEEKPCVHCGAKNHHPFAYIAGMIYHEAQHPLRKHFQRANELGIDKDGAKRWNYATDCEINDEAVELFGQLFKQKNRDIYNPGYPLICLYPGAILPKLYDLKDHLSCEEYYNKLPENCDKDGDGGKGKGQGDEDHGSGATGIPQPWELGPPTDQSPGVSRGDANHIQRDVAKNIIKSQSRGMSSLNSMLEWAKEQLPKSQYNWKAEFNKVIRYAVSHVFGFRRTDTTRLHKDSAAANYNVITNDKVGVKTNLLTILDSSGSMLYGGRTRHARAELQQILKTVRAKVTFVMGDWDVGELQVIKNLYDVKPTGGGGTSMKRVTAQALSLALKKQKKKPNLIVLITDGETDWPTKEELLGIPMVACIVNERKDYVWDQVPAWIKKVWIPIKES